MYTHSVAASPRVQPGASSLAGELRLPLVNDQGVASRAAGLVNEGTDLVANHVVGAGQSVVNEVVRPSGDRGADLLPDAMGGFISGAKGPRWVGH
jgi:hypothetical protein